MNKLSHFRQIYSKTIFKYGIWPFSRGLLKNSHVPPPPPPPPLLISIFHLVGGGSKKNHTCPVTGMLLFGEMGGSLGSLTR